MIVTTDIYEILHDRARDHFGIEDIHDGWNAVKSPLTREAIVIVTPTPIEPDTYWEKAYAHVNILVPDYLGEVSTLRLNQLERMAEAFIHQGITGSYDGTSYTIGKDGLGIERDDTLRCGYVNLVLLFEILNVR